MPTFRRESVMPVPPAALYAWHGREGAFERLAPPWQELVVTERHGTIQNGDTITIRLHQGPVWLTWKAVHEAGVEGSEFTDRMVSGPFPEWVHRHHFAAGPSMGTSELRDVIQYRLPAGAFGEAVMGSKIAGDLGRSFRFRHERTRLDLTLHNRFAEHPRLRVGVTEWHAPVGRQLCGLLSTGGHTVFRIGSHTPQHEPAKKDWLGNLVTEPAALPPPGQLIEFRHELGTFTADEANRLDVMVVLPPVPLAEIVNLHGEPRARVMDSVRERCLTIASAMGRLRRPPPRVILISDAAIHGRADDRPVDESAPLAGKKIGAYLQSIEECFFKLAEIGVSVLAARIGRTVREALDCKQPVAWMSDDDLLDAIVHFAYSSDTGPVLAAAPYPGSKSVAEGLSLGLSGLNHDIGNYLNRVFASPGKKTLAERTPVASCKRLLGSGFEFRYATLAEAATFQLGLGSA